jgi:hypothetical protein
MTKLLTPAFTRAVADYHDLLNRGYPERRTRLLVADTYGLSRAQRTVLHRGVFSDEVNERRRALKLPLDRPAAGAPQDVAIDYFNVLYTIMNYLFGRFVYISTDGFLRDNGEDYRSLYREEKFEKAVSLLGETLVRLGAETVELFIDSGFTEKSGAAVPLGDFGGSLLSERCPQLRVTISDMTDRLMNASRASLKASADSRIIDRSRTPVADLPREVLESVYNPGFPDLGRLIGSS